MNLLKRLLQLLFALCMTTFPVLLQGQENAGDVWLDIPEGVQEGKCFSFNLYVNSGTQNVGSYGLEVIPDSDYAAVNFNCPERITPGPAGDNFNHTFPDTRLFCVGFSQTGIGPGQQLHLLTFTLQAKKEESARFSLT